MTIETTEKKPTSGRQQVVLDDSIDDATIEQLQKLLHVRMTEYIPHKPWPKQAAYLCDLMNEEEEVLFGGAAGGGKSDALLMGALQFADVPGYSALLIRKTYPDLAQSGGLMDRAYEWLGPTAATWNDNDKRWEFPVEGAGLPARLQFGYLDRELAKYRYQGGEYHYIGIDELTQLPWESAYTYLFSRMRRLVDFGVPMRMRGATNPGGLGGVWVRERFIPDPEYPNIKKPPFIASFVEDNPAVDIVDYLRMLKKLDPVEYARLRLGDWFAIEQGEYFPRDDFQFIDYEDLPQRTLRARGWDKAATQDGGNLTAGVLISADDVPRFFVEDFVWGHWGPRKRDKMIYNTAQADGKDVEIWIEEEGGSGGAQSAQISAQQLAGFNVFFQKATSAGGKINRARPFAAQVQGKNVYLVRGPWNASYLSYVCPFPGGTYKDPVDASGTSFNNIAARALAVAQSHDDQDAEEVGEVLQDYRGR